MKAGRTAGHTVRTQHGVTEAQANGAATWRSATTSKSQRAAGAWSSTCPSLTTCLAQVATLHVQQNGLLSHAQDLDVPLRLASQRKINSLKALTIPAVLSTSTACTANFWVFFFYRPTGRPRRTSLPLECHRNATNRTRSVSSARHSTSRCRAKSDSRRPKRRHYGSTSMSRAVA